MKIGIIVSRFNSDITGKLLEGALAQLHELKVKQEDITVIKVPGAVEIPIAAQRLAMTNQFSAIICLGAVIRGETDHYRYVCLQVTQGCQTVALKWNIPVIYGVLTTKNRQQAEARVGGGHSHMGRESAMTAVEMIRLLEPYSVNEVIA